LAKSGWDCPNMSEIEPFGSSSGFAGKIRPLLHGGVRLR
jgi:hypothetical protein